MEKDIKILEERVTTLKRHIKNYEESDCKTNVYQQLVKECNAIENILKRYKELEEENKKLKESETYLYDAYQDAGKKMFEYAEELEKSIPISVIQNKINGYLEYDKIYKTHTSDGRENFTMEYFKAQTLKELLEERNK